MVKQSHKFVWKLIAYTEHMAINPNVSESFLATDNLVEGKVPKEW